MTVNIYYYTHTCMLQVLWVQVSYTGACIVHCRYRYHGSIRIDTMYDLMCA